ncbi:DUF3558 domain-containing protein [Parasphingorhabdus pacifica]
MRRTVLSSGIAALFVVATVGLTACGSTEGTPEGDTSEPSNETESSSGAQPAADVDPCTMVTPDEAGQLGAEGAGEAKDVAGAATCRWRVDDGRLSIAFHHDKALSDLNATGGQVESNSIAGRKAKVIRDLTGSGSCSVAFSVSDSTSLTVDGITTTDTETACQLAEQAAPLVAAKLPQE